MKIILDLDDDTYEILKNISDDDPWAREISDIIIEDFIWPVIDI